MFRRLPSPAALRTFESAARLGSFKAAAEELAVTPTAVSHQVRALEDALDTALFVRKTRQVQLTEIGAALAPALTRGFATMQAAFDEVLTGTSVLTISTTPAFALLRLVPELPGFYAIHPDITVQIDSGTKRVDLIEDRRVDLAIRYGTGPYADLENIRLFSDHYGAYASPSLESPGFDWSSVPLLETRWQQPVLADVNWPKWLAAAGMPTASPERIIRFNEEHYVLQAAIAGHGVALASTALVVDMVNRGLLVPVKTHVQLDGMAYTALCIEERRHTRKLRAFLPWLTGCFTEGNRGQRKQGSDHDKHGMPE